MGFRGKAVKICETATALSTTLTGRPRAHLWPVCVSFHRRRPPMNAIRHLLFPASVVLLSLGIVAQAADQPQWGQQFTRNMISAERALPDTFESGYRGQFAQAGTVGPNGNIRWVAQLGTQTYGTTVVAEAGFSWARTTTCRRQADCATMRACSCASTKRRASISGIWSYQVDRIRFGDFYRIA